MELYLRFGLKFVGRWNGVGLDLKLGLDRIGIASELARISLGLDFLLRIGVGIGLG